MANVVQVPELIIHIVENLASSTRSLLACSLVSSAWYLCVRPYLFATVCLRGQRTPLITRIPAFLACIKPTNSIGQYIQTLLFREGQRKDPYVNSTVLASLFPHLPCLHSLYLIDIAFKGAEIPLPHLEPPRKIRSLSFRFKASESYTVQHVLDILGLFSHVDELRLSSDDPEGDEIIRGSEGNPATSVHVPGQPFTISKFILNPGMHVYNSMLVRLGETRSVLIEYLDVGIFVRNDLDWEDLGALTRNNRATIQTLIFKPRNPWFEPPLIVLRRPFLYMHRNLPNLQSLQSFTLHHEILNQSELHFPKIWALLSASLLELPISLHHIKLVLLPRMHPLPEVILSPIKLWSRDGLSWEVIRKAFDRLTALETATFINDGKFLPTPHPRIHHDGVLEKIKAELSQLARSSLVIRYETVERQCDI
ncbi:hypothetical protein PHLCEN_2v7274 [Hermanssonia centrifuga]|uniref:Uncharacterized protein n=1 Tax=Hermanssonia centrifuga TaxID=98765 RepID=A0A2R6NWX6_9APHY|nr:hypothetical protein PHLCEN_2v7274 [Hermanssonia centrifuga]